MMKEFIITDFKPILKTCFAKDAKLLSKWHVRAGFGLDICVNQTFDDMTEAKVEFHVVYEERELIGYFGKEQALNAIFLTGFFVMPEHRNKENLREFWALVKQVLGPTFFCGLYAKNQPAIDFITNNNGKPMTTLEHNGEPGIIYRIEEHRCQ